MAEQVALWARLVGASVRSEMQYRTSFILRLIGSFVVTFIDFAGIAIIMSRIPLLVGWSLGEVGLLYGLSATAFSLAEMLAGSFDFFDEVIRLGTLDQMLIRPVSTLLLAITERFSFRRFGRAAQGATVMVIAQGLLGMVWTPDKLLVLFVALAGGIAIYFCIFLFSAVFCFWTVQGREAMNVFTYGGDFTASYPLDAYGPWLRRFVTFIVPLAFVNYEPALYLLDRPDPLGLPGWTRLASPAVAALLAILAWRAWTIGVRRYQSTGS